jgi:hypothetical protein
MHDLPDGPAAGSIGRVELLVREAGDGVAQTPGCGRDLGDGVVALSEGERGFVLIFADRVAQVHSGSPEDEINFKSKIGNLKQKPRHGPTAARILRLPYCHPFTSTLG